MQAKALIRPGEVCGQIGRRAIGDPLPHPRQRFSGLLCLCAAMRDALLKRPHYRIWPRP